jgi:hypothetical protein
MRHVLLRSLAAFTCFCVFSLPKSSAAPKPDQSDKPDFNGTWTLDLTASTSVEPLMKQIGANLFEQKYAAWITLKATVHQTEQVLTVATRGLGFSLDRTLYLDGRTDPSNKQLLGATALKTRSAWSEDQTQLVETHQIKTRQGKEGQLIIKRYLINDGKSMVLAFTVKLNAEPQITSASEIWRKQP